MSRRTLLFVLLGFASLAAVFRAGSSGYQHAVDRKAFEVGIALDRFGIRMINIPGGAFSMGMQGVEESLESMYRIHPVRVSPFKMSETEITTAQYRRVLEPRDSLFVMRDSLPAIFVTWKDAARFCNVLSRRLRLEPCYNEITWECDFSRNGFRLPTEAEWEFACRAGTTTRFNSGDTEADLARIAWYRGNSRNNVPPVRRKVPNAFGLYDMSGGVLEWCHDWFAPYPEAPGSDPVGPDDGSNRALRGGSWFHSVDACRSAYRQFSDPDSRRNYVGFRIVRRE